MHTYYMYTIYSIYHDVAAASIVSYSIDALYGVCNNDVMYQAASDCQLYYLHVFRYSKQHQRLAATITITITITT